MKDGRSYKKGPLGYMRDMRESMGEIAAVSREWCKAFDAGGEEALEHLGAVFAEQCADLTAAMAGYTKAARRED